MPYSARLTSQEIESLIDCWLPESYLFYTPVYKDFGRHKEMIPYWKQLHNHRVIEIGPGASPINRDWECEEYTGVQPFPCNIEGIGNDYVLKDGLSFLKEQKDSSAIVVSFGVLDESVLNPLSIGGELGERYINEFVGEIKRVSHPFAIVIGFDASKYLGTPNIFEVPARMGGIYSFKI